MPQSAEYSDPEVVSGEAQPMDPRRSVTMRDCIKSELGHTLNSRIFYLVTGIGLGLVIAMFISNRKGASIL